MRRSLSLGLAFSFFASSSLLALGCSHEADATPPAYPQGGSSAATATPPPTGEGSVATPPTATAHSGGPLAPATAAGFPVAPVVQVVSDLPDMSPLVRLSPQGTTVFVNMDALYGIGAGRTFLPNVEGCRLEVGGQQLPSLTVSLDASKVAPGDQMSGAVLCPWGTRTARLPFTITVTASRVVDAHAAR